MNTRTFLAAFAVFAALALPAAASSDDAKCNVTDGTTRMSVEAIKEKLTGMGYQVRKIEDEDGCYEAYAIGADGKKQELYIHPASGEIVKMKAKD